MAAPSPSLSNNSSDTTFNAAVTVPSNNSSDTIFTAAVTVPFNHLAKRTGTPPKTLRGLNKPKCRVCGNVARSRCPFQSCKNCCARNQNPCSIHVLKANAIFSDKTPTFSSPLFDKQSADPSSSGTSLRVASLRQLSSNFAQFNNVQTPLRSRKPLTRKDAAAINEWRFSKLREFRERHIEAENEAFDRYMQNVNLLEEVFSMKSMIDASLDDGPGPSINSPTEGDPKEIIPGLKLKLGLNPVRSDNSRKRKRQIVEDGLSKLQKVEATDNVDEVTDQAEPDKEVADQTNPVRSDNSRKRKRQIVEDGLSKLQEVKATDSVDEVTDQAEPNKEVADQTNLNDGRETVKGWHALRARALGNLIDKLNKARNEEDLKSCLAMKHQLFNQHITSSQTESEETEMSKEQATKKDLDSRKESGYSLPKLSNKTSIDQETLNQIDAHFCSLKQIDNL